MWHPADNVQLLPDGDRGIRAIQRRGLRCSRCGTGRVALYLLTLLIAPLGVFAWRILAPSECGAVLFLLLLDLTPERLFQPALSAGNAAITLLVGLAHQVFMDKKRTPPHSDGAKMRHAKTPSGAMS